MAAPFKHYINGRWETGVTLCVSDNPSDLDEVVGEFARADASQAGQAIRAAVDAQGAWADSAPQRRFDVLDFIGSELLARKDELGRLLAREEGKSLSEAVAETVRAGQIFKFFAAEVLRARDDRPVSARPGIEIDVTREPVGVVAVITPWNFPLAVPAWQIAPALACGNTVVFKPAELVACCAWALAEIISRSGLPAGVFNLVMGSGRMVGHTLAESTQVDAVSFAGSAETGQAVLKTVTARGGKAQVAAGGRNSLVVLADADIDRAVECAVQGAFFSTGQRCTASSRLIVEAAVHERFVARLRERTAALVVGHALERTTQIGPVASASQMAQDMACIEGARSTGAQLLCGGNRLERRTRGYYLSPALFLAQPQHRIAREEIFGPVACVLRAEDDEHALALANDSPDGLCAGVCTTSLRQATRFRRRLRSGTVMVNLPTVAIDPHVPFGGRRASGRGGREQGGYAAEFFTTVKTAYMDA
jgi:alpha-ketoglutaric semialdehyde dehydrogenase